MTRVASSPLWLWKPLACRDELSRRTHPFLGSPVKAWWQDRLSESLGAVGVASAGSVQEDMAQKMLRRKIREDLATDWMAGVRKAGEGFFWNSERDDKQKCSDTV